MSYMIIEAVLGAALLAHCACIQIMMMKDNIFVPQGARYEYELTIQQTENNLNPFSNMTLNHTIANSITTTQQYFDYFPYLSKGDKICYQDAVGNMSYLFPCSFLHSIFAPTQTVSPSSALPTPPTPTLSRLSGGSTRRATISLWITLPSPSQSAQSLTRI